MSEDSVREDLRALAKQTTDHLHALSKETAENSERWVAHERDCEARYGEMRRDIREMMRFVKWLVASMIVLSALVVSKGTLLPSFDVLLSLVK